MVATAQRAAPKRNFGFLQSSGPVAGFGIWRWCWLMKLLGSAVRVCRWTLLVRHVLQDPLDHLRIGDIGDDS